MKTSIDLTLFLNVDPSEHPTYDNAFIERGFIGGRDLTPLEIDALNLSQVLIQILAENKD